MNLVVYSQGVRAGVLDMAPGESFYGFTYDSDYLASADALPLSLSLPLQTERFDGARALPFFEGLLPEGDVRAAIARQLGISEHSPAKLLRALGRDCAGDVAVLEKDDPYQPPSEGTYGVLNDGLERIAHNPFGEISRLRAGNRLSLAGGQEKIALYHDNREAIGAGWYVPLEGSPSTHIIKPQVSDAYPQLVHNEFLCMELARLAGLDVARTTLVNLERPLLVVERFDRVETGKANDAGLTLYRRIRQEDFCQALGFDSSRKYEADGGPGIAAMCALVVAHGSRAIADRDRLLRLVLFNYLIGNCDAHAKNYSLFLGKGRVVRLAPAYDLVSTTVYDGTFGAALSRAMGMRIGEHANIDRVTRDDFSLLAEQVGVREAHLRNIASDLAHSLLAAYPEAWARLRGETPDDTTELAARIHDGIETRAEVATAI